MTVLLLAPVGLDHRYWQWVDLGSQSVVAHDLPGFGGRARSPRRPRMVDWVADVAAFLESTHGGPFDVVGCSLGAMVAQQLALSRPSLVRSLVLACTGASAARNAMLERAARVEAIGMEGVLAETLERWFTAKALETRSHPGVIYARSTLLSLDPHAFADGWHVVGDHDLRGRLGEITAPTTCIAALEDRAAPYERLEALAGGISGARLVTLAGAHMVALEDAPGFAQVVRNHLEWVERSSGDGEATAAPLGSADRGVD